MACGYSGGNHRILRWLTKGRPAHHGTRGPFCTVSWFDPVNDQRSGWLVGCLRLVGLRIVQPEMCRNVDDRFGGKLRLDRKSTIEELQDKLHFVPRSALVMP